jgi:glycosyltransferase involved in cell wall biosynthesis
MIRLLVDGVFFQLSDSGIARVWRSVLGLLAQSPRFEIYMLDRGNAPNVDGVTRIPFPSYHYGHCPNDSMLIQKLCAHIGADAFTSTYFTTPIDTPMLLMVHDMIPEMFEFDLSERAWMEKESAIAYAQRYICVSENTKRDLLSFYPEIAPDRVMVRHCGVDRAKFRPRSEADIAQFRQRFALGRPYFLFVGSRVQHNGYKNSALFFDALRDLRHADFDVLCVGGESDLAAQEGQCSAMGVGCRGAVLSDDDLSLAFGGAIALVYPSLYEGFGLPVIEAMACGCPVITTLHGSLAESAGKAAHVIDGFSIGEMLDALRRVRDPNYRGVLIDKGLEHSQSFGWETMAEGISGQLQLLVGEARTGMYDSFFSDWRRLRHIQSSVDLT